jgi:hypothetical protein
LVSAKPASEAGKGIGIGGIGRQAPVRLATQTRPKHLSTLKSNPSGTGPTEISASKAGAAEVKARRSLGQ